MCSSYYLEFLRLYNYATQLSDLPDEIIGHDEEWVTIDETAAAAAAAAALELEHAKKATENKNAAIILEQEKEKEMPEQRFSMF